VILRTEPALDAEDDAGLFGLGRDLLQASHRLVRAGLVIAEVVVVKEREQDDAVLSLRKSRRSELVIGCEWKRMGITPSAP
jgi:hypothetical protein